MAPVVVFRLVQQACDIQHNIKSRKCGLRFAVDNVVVTVMLLAVNSGELFIRCYFPSFLLSRLFCLCRQ